MDFSYHYTEEQQELRVRVSDWLDRNAPANLDALLDSPDGARAVTQLATQLGRQGWLAPSESEDEGGAGLPPDLTVIVLEELNRRGLLSLVEGEAQSLRTALRSWGTGEQKDSLGRSLARGALRVWKHRIAVSSRPDDGGLLDTDSVGVSAAPDGDAYVVSGAGLFTGIDALPDLLWTLALVSDGDGPEMPVSLVIDAATAGVSLPHSKTMSAGAPRTVEFDEVWVLKSNALGAEGEGHRVLSTQVSTHPGADLPTWVEIETDTLLDYARTSKSGGRPLGADPIRARILVEAYIASRVSRLLRMRAAWLLGQRGDSLRASALASLKRRKSASELSDAVHSVVGPGALLSSGDPAAPAGGRFDRLSRRELAERDSGTSGDSDRESISADLRLVHNP